MRLIATNWRNVLCPPALAFLCGCGGPDVPLTLSFDANYGDAAIACDAGPGPVQLTDLRLYVSELHLFDTGGNAVPIRLTADSQWQQADLALVDLENAAGSCENGTSAMHSELVGTVPPGDYRGLGFTVGVPFDRNHGDPLLAEPPLGDTAMHWSWRGGYKFFRAGIRTTTDGFWIHLGSTGCRGTVQNISGCEVPNRVAVSLPDFEPGRHRIVIDLAALIAAVDLDDSAASDCSSGPAETACAGPFAALGLDVAPAGAGSEQRVFRTGRLD